MPSEKDTCADGGSDRAQQHRIRLRTRKTRVLADLQMRVDETAADLKDHETTIAELAERFDKYRFRQTELEHRLAALEGKYETALDELRANRQRYQQHLSRLERSVERQRHAANELEQIIGGYDQ